MVIIIPGKEQKEATPLTAENCSCPKNNEATAGMQQTTIAFHPSR